MALYSYSWFPQEFYGVVEFFMGVILGVWLPLLKVSRNSDCFYSYVDFGFLLWEWAYLFDFRYEWLPNGDWCLLGGWCSTVNGWENFIINGTKPLTTVLTAYTIQNSCLRELEYSREVHWLQRYKNKGERKEDEKLGFDDPLFKNKFGDNIDDIRSFTSSEELTGGKIAAGKLLPENDDPQSLVDKRKKEADKFVPSAEKNWKDSIFTNDQGGALKDKEPESDLIFPRRE